MSVLEATAPGKIILSGEYAVVFGHRALAVPSAQTIHAQWAPDLQSDFSLSWSHAEPIHSEWQTYVSRIAELANHGNKPHGALTIRNTIPLGKGMGSSTALVIAITRAIADADEAESLSRHAEDIVNPGHSGIDFSVIWNNTSTLFRRGELPVSCSMNTQWLRRAMLIDTGMPNEPTKELVAWVKERAATLETPLATIGTCTERLLLKEDPVTVMRDHHRAQVQLGVVTKETEALIATIETSGGAAKVIGAGGRTGGSGMVLAIGCTPDALTQIASRHGMKALPSD